MSRRVSAERTVTDSSRPLPVQQDINHRTMHNGAEPKFSNSWLADLTNSRLALKLEEDSASRVHSQAIIRISGRKDSNAGILGSD